MTFEQLQEINHIHFDEDKLVRFSEYIVYNENLYAMFGIALVYRYMIKLNQFYDLGLQFSCLNTHIFKNIISEEIDDFVEFVYDYRNMCEDIFFDVISNCGFEIIQFPTDIDFWHEATSENDEDNLDHIISCLKKWEPGWEKIIDDLQKHIEDSIVYLEDGEVFILRNNNEWYFSKICSRYEDIIKQYLFTEKEEIIRAMDYLKYPLVFSYQYKEGECDEYSYCYFDIGCDGCDYLDFSVINWNWVIGSIVLKRLLDDFYSKLKDYIIRYGLEEIN